MGIKGLHKGLNFCTKKSSLRDFRGQRLAIDSSSWLHRSVYSISERYVESMERKQMNYSCIRTSSNYMINRCQELLDVWHVSKVYFVMDGKRCPLKAVYEAKEREERRVSNLKGAREFKSLGMHYKAEEKYKMCIKIRDDFAYLVMQQVSEAFGNDDRVELVWSPYEADAQLAKLCMDLQSDAVITEDSDVLVYSAAAHTAFPVLFKVDRQSGKCDVISMDWLISGSANKRGTSSNGLEGLLLNFASREARRPGFGVRLFVQGCVLAGCDYAPNMIPGVGLVNAFKLIRDNSFRNDNQRFQKLLDLLPRKVKNTINIQEYESTLAKSEAVFYYHVVAHLNGTTSFISKPRITKGENGEDHHVTDHTPFLGRFEEEWSFLGTPETNPTLPPPSFKSSNTIANKTTNISAAVAATTTIQKPRPHLFSKVTGNPYQKHKKRQGFTSKTNKRGLREQSASEKNLHQVSNSNSMKSDNPFVKFGFKHQEKSNIIRNHLQSNDVDPRAVKRQFPSLTKEFIPSKKKSNPSHSLKKYFPENNGFDYDVDEADFDASVPMEARPQNEAQYASVDVCIKNDDELVNHDTPEKKLPEMFDLTSDSNSCTQIVRTEYHDDMSALGESDFSPGEDSICPKPNPSATGEATDVVVASRQSKDDNKNLKLFQSLRGHQKESTETTSTTSKYFRQKRSRRITLDPSDDICDLKNDKALLTNELSSIETKSGRSIKAISTPSPGDKSQTSDEMVESPLSDQSPVAARPSIPRHRYTNKVPKNTIQAAFLKQKRLASSQFSFSHTSKKRSKIPYSQRTSNSMHQDIQPKLDSWFGTKRSSSARTPFFQLESNRTNSRINANDDDSLWSD